MNSLFLMIGVITAAAKFLLQLIGDSTIGILSLSEYTFFSYELLDFWLV